MGGSTLGGGDGGGLGGRHGGSVGVTLRGNWGSLFRYSIGICVAAWVRFVGEVVVGVDAPVSANMSVSCRMASMFWAPNWVKSAAGAGFARSSARVLSVSMAVLAENMTGMAPFWWGNCIALVMRSPHV